MSYDELDFEKAEEYSKIYQEESQYMQDGLNMDQMILNGAGAAGYRGTPLEIRQSDKRDYSGTNQSSMRHERDISSMNPEKMIGAGLLPLSPRGSQRDDPAATASSRKPRRQRKYR